jgi:phosphoheptose isomerase
MTVLPREPKPDDKVATVAISAGLAFDAEYRDRTFGIALQELLRARGNTKGDVIVAMVPQGFSSRVVEHVNKAAAEAIANAR